MIILLGRMIWAQYGPYGPLCSPMGSHKGPNYFARQDDMSHRQDNSSCLT